MEALFTVCVFAIRFCADVSAASAPGWDSAAYVHRQLLYCASC
jgi:hypothetical protein